jgi:hypothetical protein
MIRVLGFAALNFALITGNVCGWAQENADSSGLRYVKYLSDQPPVSSDLARLPSSAENVMVAQVQVLDTVVPTAGRHGERREPGVPGYMLRIRIVSVLVGDAGSGTDSHVFFDGGNDESVPRTRTVFPPAPSQRKFFIVSFTEGFTFRGVPVRRLLAFPAHGGDYS